MSIKQVENNALNLTSSQRAALAHKLLISLDMPNSYDDENSILTEINRRADEIDNGEVQLVSSASVSKKAHL
ncbi:MAG: addiction module antitoxin RelB [Gammaproteobacteria bacterium]|nr:MAG: addiction module antitoxin RelB [Gammaproteobacteria bacterium]